MRCLIDADILVYELASCGQYKEEDSDDIIVRDFDFVADLLDQKIKEIEGECWATEPSLLFLTNDSTLNKLWNRQRKTEGKGEVSYLPNFRIATAVSKPYKGTRESEKPFHRDNVRAYMLHKYNCVVANGMEADDLLAIHQTAAEPLTTIICSRDKDLRMVEGMQFGWPCGKQPQFGPKCIDKFGEIELIVKERIKPDGRIQRDKSIKGTGSKFFYSQLITGDSVDNIPGLPRGGPALAFKLLDGARSEGDMFRAVAERYEDKFGDGWEGQLKEQADLLWMVRELNDKGEPILWEMPNI